jgi:hypothetical protein
MRESYFSFSLRGKKEKGGGERGEGSGGATTGEKERARRARGPGTRDVYAQAHLLPRLLALDVLERVRHLDLHGPVVLGDPGVDEPVGLGGCARRIGVGCASGR